ncbi:MAG: rhomboid family intramembrane serine protease [Acidobacteriota bacterium]
MIPLKDDNPARSFPAVTLIVVIANVAAFVYELLLPPPARDDLIRRMAVVPVEFAHPHPPYLEVIARDAISLLTAMFLHGGALHLLGNMLYLWIFGKNVEDTMGHRRFAVFYLVAGAAGSLVQIAAHPASAVPMIGASGAIAGVLGAYLVLFPTARVQTLVFLVFFARIVPIPALIVLGVWLLIQVVNAGRIAPGEVAWFAHLGGFAAGLTLVVLFRRRRPRHSLY